MRVFIIFTIFLVQINFSQSQELEVGPLVGSQIWDYDDPNMIGMGPSGSGFGIILGIKDGPTILESFIKFGQWSNKFVYENLDFEVAATDLIIGGGLRREILFPQMHGRLGLSVHQLTGTLNGSDVANSDFDMALLKEINGRRVAGFFGVGVKFNLSSSKLACVVDFLVHKFPGNTLYDIEGGLFYYF